MVRAILLNMEAFGTGTSVEVNKEFKWVDYLSILQLFSTEQSSVDE